MNPEEKSRAANPAEIQNSQKDYTTEPAEISLFKGFSDKEPRNIQVEKLVDAIRSGKWKNQIDRLRQLKQSDQAAYSKEKLSLPFFTMTGTFSERNKGGFRKPSGYIILDIDGLSVEQLSEIKQTIESDHHTAICFTSPSGTGLKVAFRTAINNDADCKVAFSAISEYFKTAFQIVLDPTGKDISRACFVSYDPAIYYNPDAVQFVYEMAAAKELEIVKPIQTAANSGKIERYVLACINGELERIAKSGRGGGNEALNIAAMKVAQLYHSGLFDKEPLKEHFVNAYLNRGGSYKNKTEAGSTFESGWTAGIREPRAINGSGQQ